MSRILKFKSLDRETGKFGTPFIIGAPNTVQFIGDSDCNGEGIYEGDVIRAQYGFVEYSGVVVFDAGAFCLKINKSSEGCNGHEPDYDIGQTPELHNFDKKEVIGNIHENPDLLGERSDDDERD